MRLSLVSRYSAASQSGHGRPTPEGNIGWISARVSSPEVGSIRIAGHAVGNVAAIAFRHTIRVAPREQVRISTGQRHRRKGLTLRASEPRVREKRQRDDRERRQREREADGC
jgi:hypothetical protein